MCDSAARVQYQPLTKVCSIEHLLMKVGSRIGSVASVRSLTCWLLVKRPTRPLSVSLQATISRHCTSATTTTAVQTESRAASALPAPSSLPTRVFTLHSTAQVIQHTSDGWSHTSNRAQLKSHDQTSSRTGSGSNARRWACRRCALLCAGLTELHPPKAARAARLPH
jgi:hypothetical protein